MSDQALRKETDGGCSPSTPVQSAGSAQANEKIHGKRRSEDLSQRKLSELRSTQQAKGHFQEWIDGNVACSTASTEVEIGIAETYVQACLAVFQDVEKLVLKEASDSQREEKDTMKESLVRLALWDDSFAAGQLDRILAGSDTLQENVLDLLTELAKSLNLGMSFLRRR